MSRTWILSPAYEYNSWFSRCFSFCFIRPSSVWPPFSIGWFSTWRKLPERLTDRQLYLADLIGLVYWLWFAKLAERSKKMRASYVYCTAIGICYPCFHDRYMYVRTYVRTIGYKILLSISQFGHQNWLSVILRCNIPAFLTRPDKLRGHVQSFCRRPYKILNTGRILV